VGAGSFGPAWLLARLTALVPDAARRRHVVALSGGADSLALLHALAALRTRGLSVRAVHVDHGLQPAARDFARLARAAARREQVPFRLMTVRVPRKADSSLEAAARAARYAALRSALRDGELLLTAHHLDDQAETLLLQLLRGAGFAGLAAMPARAPFGAGLLVRPLLEVPRARLRAYVERAGIEWAEDAMNADLRFDRAWLRARVMPLLASRWPAAPRTIARSAAVLGEGLTQLDALAGRELDAVIDGDGLDAAALRRHAPAARRLLLRAWLAERGVPMPDRAALERLAGPWLAASPHRRAELAWRGAVVVREAGRLVAHRRAGSPRTAVADPLRRVPRTWAWQRARSIELEAGELTLLDDPHGDVDLDALPQQLLVRTRVGGERLRLLAGGPTKAVKDLLQSARVPTDERARLPFVHAAGELLAVGDRWIAARIRASAKTASRARFVLRGSPAAR
jgi:tRNA(Ile)-lysidine synthase